MANDRKGARKPRREKKNVPHAVANIHATFNNTIVTFTDPSGNTLCWSSGGRIGYKGSRKGTPYAAQLAARNAAEQAQDNGVRSVEVRVKGPGPGRESAIRAVAAAGILQETDLVQINSWIEEFIPEPLQ